jgi:zinc protease
MPGKFQADLVMGHPSIPRQHPDWMAASMANAVLGVFGMMGRLGENVRDRRGLAYYAYSRLVGGLGPGPWYAAAGVNPAGVDEAIDAMIEEIHRLRDHAVPAAELDDVKAYLTGSLPLQLETNEGIAQALGDMVLYDLGLDYLHRYAGLVSAVTPEAVQAAARAHVHPDRLAIVVAGPGEPPPAP